jgi:hypothetical protein
VAARRAEVVVTEKKIIVEVEDVDGGKSNGQRLGEV